MRYPNVLVLGGTGFVGQAIVSRLASMHHHIVVPSRRRRAGRELFLLPTVQVLQADVHDDATLNRLIEQADAVINLVGVLHSSGPADNKPYGREFDQAHVQLPARIARACAASGKRLIHVSALGADPANERLPSGYLRSKAAGERAIADSGCQTWTILRPSVVFGPGDKFLNLFASLQQWFPVLAMGRTRAQLQPVYVGDVANATANILDNPNTFGQCYELAGPEIYTLAELVRLAGRYRGRTSKLIELSDSLATLQAKVLEKLPGPTLMSVDNFESLAKPSIATGPVAPELGINPTPIAVVAPAYLHDRASPNNEIRARARR